MTNPLDSTFEEFEKEARQDLGTVWTEKQQKRLKLIRKYFTNLKHSIRNVAIAKEKAQSGSGGKLIMKYSQFMELLSPHHIDINWLKSVCNNYSYFNRLPLFQNKSRIKKWKSKRINKNLLNTYDPYDRSYDWKIYFEATNMYSNMIQDILNAKKIIYFESYIFNPDTSGWSISKALAKKALEFKKTPEADEVYVILDALGSAQDKTKTKEFEDMIKFLEDSGVHVHFFNSLSKSLKETSLKLLLIHPITALLGRNHRKTLIIDSQICYIGGMNISDNCLKERDTHIRLTGYPAMYLKKSFLKMLTISKHYHKRTILNFHQEIKKFKSGIRRLKQNSKNRRKGVLIEANLPSILSHDILENYIKLINSAQININIITPYFTPISKLVNSLITAVKREVKVTIIIPEKSDHSTVDFAAKKYVRILTDSGVKVVGYNNPSKTLIHAKTMTIDGQYATIGSANLDKISLTLNYESNAFFANKDIAIRLDIQFEEDLKYCKEFNLKSLGFFTRIKIKFFSRLNDLFLKSHIYK